MLRIRSILGLASAFALWAPVVRADPPSEACRASANRCHEAYNAFRDCDKSKGPKAACKSERAAVDSACKASNAECQGLGDPPKHRKASAAAQ